MNVLKILVAAVLLTLTSSVQAQLTKEQINERKELKKASKSELNEKASKVARKEAKKLKKDGWLTSPGALPIDKQLDKSYMMQMEYDEDMFPKYIMAEGMAIGENYDGAKLQAIELAKQNLAGQIQTEVTALVENSVDNAQLQANEAATVTKTISAAKNLISQQIGRTLPIVELYRTVKKTGNKEVLVRLAYNSKMAKAAAKQAMRAGLEQESDDLQKKLDEVMGW